MAIKLYSISKTDNDCYTNLSIYYEKLISKYTKINTLNIYTKEIQKAQKLSAKDAKLAYSKGFSKHLGEFNIALSENGKNIDSHSFAQIISTHSNINFFIAGSYGFESGFLNSCQECLSLGRLTLAHKLARLVLLEQIYRAYTIINAHPYHK